MIAIFKSVITVKIEIDVNPKNAIKNADPLQRAMETFSCLIW